MSKQTETKEKTPDDSVVVVGLNQFDDGPMWWIGYYHYHPDSAGSTLEEADLQEDFGNCFDTTECIETHPPDAVALAIAKAHTIARDQKLPLYRTTQFRDANDTELQVFEELSYSEL